MPYIVQNFSHVISSDVNPQNIYNTSNSPYLYIRYNKTSQKIPRIHRTYQELFYQDMKTMLTKTGLNISFDDEQCTFTIFNLTFGIYAMVMYKSHNSNYCCVPVILRHGSEYERDLQYLVGINYYDNPDLNITNYACNYSIVTYPEYNMLYRINIQYNENTLNISYGSSTDINTEYNILFLCKGNTVGGREICYYSNDTNCLNSNNSYAPLVVHYLVYCDDAYSSTYMPCVGNSYQATALTGQGIFSKIDIPLYLVNILNNNEDSNSIALIKPICCFGYINFDNLYITRGSSPSGYIEINGDMYFCPKTANANPTNRLNQSGYVNYWNKMIFKL